MPTAAIQLGRACGAKFTVATTSPRDLAAFFMLMVLTQNDSSAGAVLTRQLSLAKSTEDKIALLDTAVAVYLRAEPAQLSAAERMVGRFDALGLGRRAVNLEIDNVYNPLLWFGYYANDQTIVTQAAGHIIALARRLTGDQLGETGWDVKLAYRMLLGLAFADGASRDSLQAIARMAQADFTRAPNGWEWGGGPLTVDSVRQLLAYGQNPYVGTPAPRLRADFWFPGGPDTVVPSAGTVSVLVGLPRKCITNHLGLEYGMWEGDRVHCRELYTKLKRWHARYGASGLSITLMTMTGGSSIFDTPQTQKEEATHIWWYVHEYLHLPVRVTILATRMMAPFPAPDGRTYPDSIQSPFYRGVDYDQKSLYAASVVIIDRSGNEAYNGSFELPQGEWSPVPDHVLAHLMHSSARTPPATATPPASSPAGANSTTDPSPAQQGAQPRMSLRVPSRGSQ